MEHLREVRRAQLCLLGHLHQAHVFMEVFAGEVVSIPGNVRHALRNTSSSPMTSITVSKQELYNFFRELARPFDPNGPPAPPTPDEMQQLFSVAEKYEYWLASPDDNAAISISLHSPADR
jgi:hypothetical protein